jgi:hypothetical protein
MIKTKEWTRIILETFLEESGLNYRIGMGDERARILEGIMRTRFAGWSIAKQAEEFHVSTDTISKYVKELSKLYDETQKNSLILPTAKKSKHDKELDTTKM